MNRLSFATLDAYGLRRPTSHRDAVSILDFTELPLPQQLLADRLDVTVDYLADNRGALGLPHDSPIEKR